MRCDDCGVPEELLEAAIAAYRAYSDATCVEDDEGMVAPEYWSAWCEAMNALGRLLDPGTWKPTRSPECMRGESSHGWNDDYTHADCSGIIDEGVWDGECQCDCHVLCAECAPDGEAHPRGTLRCWTCGARLHAPTSEEVEAAGQLRIPEADA